MHPAYFETRFRVPAMPRQWPGMFVIVSAYATTGQTWSHAKNVSADLALASQIRDLGCWMHRITGYSPTTDHAEPSWAAEMELLSACELGLRFEQDAIYLVEGNQLYVLKCHQPESRLHVDAFTARLDITSTSVRNARES